MYRYLIFFLFLLKLLLNKFVESFVCLLDLFESFLLLYKIQAKERSKNVHIGRKTSKLLFLFLSFLLLAKQCESSRRTAARTNKEEERKK